MDHQRQAASLYQEQSSLLGGLREEESNTHTLKSVLGSDLSDTVISVGGVLLPTKGRSEDPVRS